MNGKGNETLAEDEHTAQNCNEPKRESQINILKRKKNRNSDQ